MLDLTGLDVLDIVVGCVVGESTANEGKVQTGNVQIVPIDAVVCVSGNKIAVEDVLPNHRSIGMRGVSSENARNNTNAAYSRRTQSFPGVA